MVRGFYLFIYQCFKAFGLSGGKFRYRFTLIVYQIIYSFQFSKKHFVRFTVCDKQRENECILPVQDTHLVHVDIVDLYDGLVCASVVRKNVIGITHFVA